MGHAAGDVVHDTFRRIEILVNDFAQLLIRQYFDAGMMLRLAETERSTKPNPIATGSAKSSISPVATSNSGCFSMLLAMISIATLMYWASQTYGAI